jgi:hypothetical protein
MTDTTIDYRPQPGDLRYGKSKVSNQPNLILGKDGRSITSRRFRDLVQNLIADAGGIESCSTAKIGLLRRLAACSVIAELLEAKALEEGDPDNVEKICNLASTALRLSARVGLSRHAKEIVPALSQYRLQPQEEDDAVSMSDLRKSVADGGEPRTEVRERRAADRAPLSDCGLGPTTNQCEAAP